MKGKLTNSVWVPIAHQVIFIIIHFVSNLQKELVTHDFVEIY